MKKIAVLFLTALLLTGMLLSGVSAEPLGPTLYLSDVILMPGSETLTLSVTMENNPGLICGILGVQSPEGFTLTEWHDTGVFGENLHQPTKPFKNPFTLCWANDLALENLTENGVLTTLDYQVADTVAPGTYEFELLPVGNDDFFDFDLVTRPATLYGCRVAVPMVKTDENGIVTDITLLDGVRTIPDGSFSGLANLQSVTVPDSVTEIGDRAFADNPGVVLYGRENSVAERYAAEHGIPFEKTGQGTPAAPETEANGWLIPTLIAVGGIVLILVLALLLLRRKKPAGPDEPPEEL